MSLAWPRHASEPPSEVGELVCFLASPESAFINAAYILIDGGSLAWRGQASDIGL